MNIYVREIKRNFKAFVIWTSAFVLYDVLIFAMWPGMGDQAASYAELFGAMPKELLAAFNIESADFGDALGYFGTYGSVYFVLAGSIYATMLGAGILSKEEGEGTVEFLLAKPVTRTDVALSKLGAAASLVAGFVAVFVGLSAALLAAYAPGSFAAKDMAMIGAGYALSFLVFMALGFLASIYVVRAKSALPLSMGIALGSFMLGVASRIAGGMEWLEWASPMDWFNANRALAAGGLRGDYSLAALCLIAALPALAVFLYNKKDIKA
jgi:ABC-2 type transport system permease protein